MCLPFDQGPALGAGGIVLLVTQEAVPVSAEMSEEIRSCLTEVETCFRLLVPFDFATGLGTASPLVDFPVSEESARCQAGAVNHEDEEQPCCSKTLIACAHLPGAVSGEGPPQTATGAKEEEGDSDGDSDSDSDGEGFVRHHGLGSHKYTLDVELSSGNPSSCVLAWAFYRQPWALGTLAEAGVLGTVSRAETPGLG